MQPPNGTVVVGVDGSHSSDQALDWAVDQAVVRRRPLTLLHALGEPTPAWTDVALALPQAAFAAQRYAGQTILDDARARVARRAPGLEVHEVLDFVDPRLMLLEATGHSALVVVGSRGRGPVPGLLLGSVGLALVRHANGPVVVHRPTTRGQVRRGVLVGTDAGAGSRPVLEAAYQQAALLDLPLTVLHCHWDIQQVTTAAYAGEPGADQAEEQLLLSEAMAGMAEKYPEVRVTAQVRHGLPEVKVALAGDESDLVVVGVHHESWVHELLVGSIATSVVEHARCPVLVVPLTR